MSTLKARRLTAVFAATLLGACGDSTAPTIDYIDTQAAALKVEPVMAVMDQPALASFTSLGDVGGLPASSSAAALRAVTQLTRSAVQGKWDRSAPLLARSAARSADVIPPDARGKTYVYNPETGSYEVASDRTDAPANGIRIVLYAWDVLSGAPSSPLTVIGHVDLTDQSTTTQNRLNVLLVRASDDAQLLNYTITHTVGTSSESFSISGSANNGAMTVTFSLSGTVNETSASATFDLSAPSVGFTVRVEMSVNAFTEQANIGIALGYDGHTLSFAMSLSANGMSGEIRFDNKRYATFSMTYDPQTGSVTTTFTKANGQPMTAQEIQAVTELFERALGVGDFWSGLLWPVGALATF